MKGTEISFCFVLINVEINDKERPFFFGVVRRNDFETTENRSEIGLLRPVTRPARL